MHTVNMATRGGVQRGPGATELRRYLDKGLTQAQIVEAWEKDSGVRIARSTVGMAIERHGLKSSHPTPRYEDMLPWRVSGEHIMANDARMLRLEGRRRRGGALNEKDKRLLTNWREALDEAGAVVTYDPATLDGFYWVGRTEDDDDIIRRPKR